MDEEEKPRKRGRKRKDLGDDVEGGELKGEEEEAEEGTLEEGQEEEIEAESVLTEYDPEEFVSGAFVTPGGTLSENLFEFEYSYGYDCLKYFNLCACDDSVVAWAAGSVVNFFDVVTKQRWFRRSTTGGSVGAVASYRKEPHYRIAIAEAAEGPRRPLILLYTWPDMQIDAVLRAGTEHSYSALAFSPDGELLASVGREPDYFLTVWNWSKHRIMLRTEAFSNDVNTVMFSPYCPGQLTTGGAAHIKFWKMINSFTGLKLQGELGRFGKTEICDVLGIYPMPDEKVLSGCEWGNILVWEAGLVKVEVTQRGRKTCHDGPVVQLMLSEAGYEVTTVAQDGCVRAWYWDTVEQADPPEDDQFVEVNPVAETCVPDCKIMCLRHQKGNFWYCQDGNGGLWTVDMELDKLECQHTKRTTTHAGRVVALAAVRGTPLLATAGADGALLVFNSQSKQLLARYKLPVAVTCMLYPPPDLEPSSRMLVLGYEDGVLRALVLHTDRILQQKTMFDIHVESLLSVHSSGRETSLIDLVMLLKPHSQAITQIVVNEPRTLLVTASRDRTIFLYRIQPGRPFALHRLGYIDTPTKVTFMTWKPETEFILLLCGKEGSMLEVELPDAPIRDYTDINSFKLDFTSCKETTVLRYQVRNRPLPADKDLASLDEEAIKAAEEAEGAEGDEEEDDWLGEVELIEMEHSKPPTLTWAHYCDEGIWVVQRETGALLLVKPGGTKVLKYAPVPGAWRDSIVTLKFICDNRYLVVGTSNGYIRMMRMPTEEEDNPDRHYDVWMEEQARLAFKLKGRRLAEPDKQPIPRIDFEDYYYLAMHDRYTGEITALEFSTDEKRFYTTGADGNIFSYVVNFGERLFPKKKETAPAELPRVERLQEPMLGEEMMSHEQMKRKEEYEKMMATAAAHKKLVREQLADLTIEYVKIVKANRQMPFSQQIDVTLDPRPLIEQEKELTLAASLTRRKLAHQLEASDLALSKMHSRNIIQLDVFPFVLRCIRDPEATIRPLRQKNLSQAFHDQLNEVHQKMAEAALKGRNNVNLFEDPPQRADAGGRRIVGRKTTYGVPRVASFLLGLPADRPHPLRKAIRNYHLRLNRHQRQFVEWQQHLSNKPDPRAFPPGAEAALREAEATIGNHVLKTQPQYLAPAAHNTQLRICLTRQEIYDIKHEFNMKVVELRKSKVKLVEKMRLVGDRLADIRVEIPARLAKQLPGLPEIDDEFEFPEKNLEVKPEAFLAARTTPAAAAAPATKKLERRKSTFAQARMKPPRAARFVPLIELKPLAATWELVKFRQDYESTPVEVEIRERRIQRHLYEQDVLLADVDVWIKEFDARLKQLQKERVRVQEKNALLELHLIQLHRETNILNRFEAQEERLAEKVYSKLSQIEAIESQAHDCENRITEHEVKIGELEEEAQELNTQFKRLIRDNKFADFLRRIYKKKYRPPRVREDDESSESESESSSSEEEEQGSDSEDIGPIRLDPNVCPEGCDTEVYEKTFTLRNSRQKREQHIMEQSKMIESLRKDIDSHVRLKRKMTFQLERKRNELREFMLEKQSCMNEVEQVIILRYDQIRARAVAGCTGPQGLTQTIVFPETILSGLRKRVLEIVDEIKEQKMRYKINRTHLHRMNIDLRAMDAEAEVIRAEMRDVVTHKLGKPRRVDHTLDELLRLMARQFKLASFDTVPQLEAQLREWKKKHSDAEKKYLSTIQEYSNRLRLAAAIQANVIPRKPFRDPQHLVGGYDLDHYNRDVVRLRIVRARQRDEMKYLREEISLMKLKQPPEKPGSSPASALTGTVRSHIEMYQVTRKPEGTKQRYFPTAPLDSSMQKTQGVNVVGLLNDALDAMRTSRDEAPQLLQDMSAQLPDVVSGKMSRYDAVDNIARKYLVRLGGDPKAYKRHTDAFDRLAALLNRLIRDYLETLEGSPKNEHKVMSELEEALKGVSDKCLPLYQRLAPALAALLLAASLEDVEHDTTMASLINSLIDQSHPVESAEIDKIDVKNVCKKIIECGVDITTEELERVVQLSVKALRAQLLDPEESKKLAAEVDQAFAIEMSQITPKLSRPKGEESSQDELADLKTDTGKGSRG